MCKDITNTGKVTDLVFHDLVSNLTPEETVAFGNVIGSIFDGINQKGLLDVKNHFRASIKGGAAAWKNLDAETKKVFKETMKEARKYVISAAKAVQKGEYKTASQRLDDEE